MNETRDAGGGDAATARSGGPAVTSARAQFDAAARSGTPRRGVPAAVEAVFDRFDWSEAVGATVQSATVHMDGRYDGAREVLMYDLDETGLLACRDDGAGGADGESVALHFVSANSRDAYDRVLRSVGYLNRSAEPHAGARRFDVEVVDATGFPVRVGERTLWVEAETAARAETATAATTTAAAASAGAAPAAAMETAAAFDTLSPEVIRLDLDDHMIDTAIGFDDAAFAARAEATAPRPIAAPAPATADEADGDRFAAHYGARGYWIHRQTAARAAAAEAETAEPAPAPAPSLFRDSATIYHIYRPAGAVAAPGAAPGNAAPRTTTQAPDAPVSFAPEAQAFRVFRRPPAPPSAAARAPVRHSPAAADRNALHFADLFEADLGPNGLERDPSGRDDDNFLFGLGSNRAA